MAGRARPTTEGGGPPKGRGRARGRARGQQTMEGGEQARRPGPGGEPGGPPQGVESHPGAPSGGRKYHRGVPRTDVPPGASASQAQEETLTASMQAMDIRSQAGGRGRGRGSEIEVATRPKELTNKKGETGESIELVANFFELLSRPQWAVVQYHVDFTPVVESSRLRGALLRDHKEALGDCFLFDGMSDLKTVRKLPNDVTEFCSQRRTDGSAVRIILKFTQELAPAHPELQRLFNTQMRRNLRHLKFQLLGRHYYDQNAINDIPQYNLQIWQGVITAIRTQEEKLMMCVDTTHKVVRKETALEIITNIVKSCSQSDHKERVARELVGCIVMTRYNNKTYSIEDIDWDLNPSKTFESREGPMVYMDYYKRQYDITITQETQPLLLCKSKEKEIKGGASVSKKIYLIPELCAMTGLTETMRSNFTLMREMATHTRIDPNARVKNLQTFIRRLNENPDVVQEMKKWDLAFANDLVRFNGRVCRPELIIQRQLKTKYDQVSGDFNQKIRGQPMHVSCNLENWMLICTQRDQHNAQDFLTNLYKVCPPMGMRVAPPKTIYINDDRSHSYLNAFKDNVNNGTQLVCFIVPNNRKERYDALKKNTFLDYAMPSQVIVSRTLSKKNMLMSVATKIGIQLNCKLGGEPWAVDIPFKMNVMIIGFDTYHDSARRNRSAGAFVASMNSTFTRWYSKVSFHSAGGWEEISNFVGVNVIEALRKYNEINKCFPDLIIYYRDGIGDGSIRYVLDWEVKPLREVIQSQLAGRNTRFTYIVVNKRINQRFFYPSRSGYGNPPPGTVVDNTVTRYDRYDFYLVSQSVRQGTVGPTLYNVIEDHSGLKPEHIQRLSYKLTHLYYNWPGTIRVPAPCQYAHKLAFLTGQSLHAAPQEALCDTLFYL